MDTLNRFEDGPIDNSDAEEEFRSCCTEDEEWQDTEESLAEGAKEELDEFSLRMYFKGVSISKASGVGSRVSGIGVVMERSAGVPILKVQKKLDFYVEELVAEHLAFLDGLLVAQQNGVRKIYAFTDSESLYYQIAETEILEDPLLVALGHRILELADKLEDFDLTLVSSFEVERPLRLAQEAVGITPLTSDGSIDYCSICCEEKKSLQMIKMNCSHKFCSDCMIMYVESKLQSLQVPIRCPQARCRHYISSSECRSFLPVTSYDLFQRVTMEADVLNVERIYCPYPNCSVLLNASQHLSSQASSSSQSDFNCIECPGCHRNICIRCDVPWHSLMTCQEFQNLPEEERDPGDITLHRLAQNSRWRRCRQCRRMIELTQGWYRMTCWCGHEFCYSCGAEYRDGIQTCQCVFWDEQSNESSVSLSNHESEMWAWDSFDTQAMAIEGYSEQERAQLALIQRFLAGGFSLSDHHPCQSPPHCSDSYVDAMKDLHQLPWLERFVSVISDSYHEDFIQ